MVLCISQNLQYHFHTSIVGLFLRRCRIVINMAASNAFSALNISFIVLLNFELGGTKSQQRFLDATLVSRQKMPRTNMTSFWLSTSSSYFLSNILPKHTTLVFKWHWKKLCSTPPLPLAVDVALKFADLGVDDIISHMAIIGYFDISFGTCGIFFVSISEIVRC